MSSILKVKQNLIASSSSIALEDDISIVKHKNEIHKYDQFGQIIIC